MTMPTSMIPAQLGWAMCGLAWAISAADPGHAATGAWENVTPTGINLSKDFPSADQNYGVQDVLADPLHPGTFYAFVCYQGCWKSVDWGGTWTHISSDGHLEQGRPWGEAMAPNGSYMLACTGYAAPMAWRSTDGGVSWRGISMGPISDPYMFDIDAKNPNHVIASFHGEANISESMDGGLTWKDKGPAGTGLSNYVFFVNSTTWLSCPQMTDNSGTFRTTNSGGSWAKVGPMMHPHGNMQIFIDPGNGAIYVPFLGTYRSNDGGATFTKVSTFNGSSIFATASTLYNLDGGATNGFNAPYCSSSPRADGATWTAISTPAAMTNGSKRAAVAFDAAHSRSVIVTGNWLAGIWRYVEK
jgi:hypothetical protein